MKFLPFAITAVLALGQGAFASVITYDALLTGAESGSSGTGTAIVTIDTVLNMMEVNVAFSGLTTGTTASHIHCCTAVAGTGTVGVATTTPTFPQFPLGVTSGTYDHMFDLTMASSYNAAFVTANGGTATSAEAALLAGLAADKAYLNIHTTLNPGGEVSGFLVAAPEPATWFLTAGALAGLAMWRRRTTKA
jgi:hypothetical protein